MPSSFLLLLAVLPTISVNGPTTGPTTFNVGPMRQGDIFFLLISPPVEGLAAVCQPLVVGKPLGGKWEMYMAVNVSETSVVEVLLESPGVYNLTTTFRSQTPWDFTIGVFTRYRDWYSLFNITRLQDRYLVEYTSGDNQLPGNHTLSILINVREVEEAGGFVIPFLPLTPFSVFLFAGATVLIAYPCVFLSVDTYFKNKREGVSRKRVLGLGLLLLLSLYVIYELYVFATVTALQV